MAEVAQQGWIGRRMPRREDRRLLRGEGRFVDDIRSEDCLFLHVVRNPFGPGAILRLDVADARDMPGVVAVLTAADLSGLGKASINPLLPGLKARPLVLLADRRVDSVGQAVAAVVATSAIEAQEAAETVVLEVAEQHGEAEPLLRHVWAGGGDIPAVSAHRIEVIQDHALVAPMALEPRAALAIPTDGGLRVHLSTQTPQRCRDDLCAILGLRRDSVRVVASDVGGAFGGKASLMPEDALTAVAAWRLNRPVKWTACRNDEFLAATQGRGARMAGVLHLAPDGTPLALEADISFPLGHWMPNSALAPIRNAGRILPGPYAVGSVRVEATALATAGPAVNIYRGAGRPEAAILMERLADRAAEAVGLDPLDWRLAHLGAAGALPTGEVVCSGNYRGLLLRLEQETGYRDLRRQQRQRRASGQICGLGLALYIEPCGQGWETAALSLDASGTVIARTGSSAQGQGRETAMAQIVAEGLGCDPGRVQVLHSDSGEVPDGIGALASRSTAIGGTAMWKCVSELAEMVRGRAALKLNCGPAEVSLGPDGVTGPGGGRLEWAALAPLGAQCRHEAEAEAWASGAVLAEVSIDAETGLPTVDRITWVDDAGRVLNPLLLEGQLWGGLAQGLGVALMERIVYDGGQLLTGSLMDYAVPRASDMPRVRILGQPLPSPTNPLGFKGVGEAGCIGVPAAVLNAVQDALLPFDAPDLNFPLTPEKLWRAIQRMP